MKKRLKKALELEKSGLTPSVITKELTENSGNSRSSETTYFKNETEGQMINIEIIVAILCFGFASLSIQAWLLRQQLRSAIWTWFLINAIALPISLCAGLLLTFIVFLINFGPPLQQNDWPSEPFMISIAGSAGLATGASQIITLNRLHKTD